MRVPEKVKIENGASILYALVAIGNPERHVRKASKLVKVRLVKVRYFNLKQNPSLQTHCNEISLMHSLLQLHRISGNASKTTYDITKFFNGQCQHPGYFKRAMVWLHWIFSFLCLFL